MTHYRRISKTALNGLRTSLTEEGVKPSEYTALASFSAVKVGVETNGWCIIQVMGEDSDDLPGKHISSTFGGLKGAAKSAVHRAKVRKTVDGETRVHTIPENEVTEDYIPLPLEGEQVEEGDAVLAVGINPHRFI